MHYDYKNIFTVDDIFLQNDGTSLIQRPCNNTTNGNISQLPNNQLLAFYKKNVSAYLIMKKIRKKDPSKFQLLLQKFKNKQQNDFPYKSFIEDTVKISDQSNVIATEESIVKNKKSMKNKRIGLQGEKKADFTLEKAVVSEPDMRKSSEKMKRSKKTKEFEKYDYDEKNAINDKNVISAIIEKDAIFTEKTNLEKSTFEKSRFATEKSGIALEKSAFESGIEKIEKNAIEKNELEKKELEKNELAKQDFEKKAREKLARSKNLENAESRIKRFKKKRFRLKVPLNQQPQMQDFNDFYDHFSEDDKGEISEEKNEDSIEDPDQLISEFLQLEANQSLNNVAENTSKEFSETKENMKISDENIEEIDYQEDLLIRKEVSFLPSEKKEISPLSIKKLRSNLRAKSTNRSGENSESKILSDENLQKEIEKNPYYEMIEKLLKSSDVFSEDIDELVGVKREKKKLPDNLLFVEESERKIYEVIYDWSDEMEGLLKKDQRDMKKYQRKMQNIFAANEEKEEESEEVVGESSEDESEDG